MNKTNKKAALVFTLSIFGIILLLGVLRTPWSITMGPDFAVGDCILRIEHLEEWENLGLQLMVLLEHSED